jgi:hypothetical protein
MSERSSDTGDLVRIQRCSGTADVASDHASSCASSSSTRSKTFLYASGSRVALVSLSPDAEASRLAKSSALPNRQGLN